ncbi:MAG: hypothetical protein HYT47_00540 [Candidatus Vogelbacteria bacterium]|nr:hypothetical protein [Candidatus Vogelbacteria bacterium]
MATKEEVLQYIRTLAEQKVVSKEELDAAFDSGSGIKTDVVLTKKLGIAEILYYIGGAIVFLGISILLWQNWSTLGFGTKVLATLGSGIAAYFVGLLFSRDERTETAGSAFYLISALVTPMGLWVVFDNAGFDASSYGTQSLISGIMLGTYLLSLLVFRKNVFTLFSILFGTWLFFSLTSFMVGGGPYFDDWKFYEYRVLVAGIAYILLGYAFSKNERAPLQGFLYGFGILGFLGAALTLGGWEPNQNVFWELIYPGFVFGALFLSVHIKSKAFLTWGTLFLMAYILKITSEYFSSGLGWPLALVIAGLAMIGVGYMSISLKKKYLSA